MITATPLPSLVRALVVAESRFGRLCEITVCSLMFALMVRGSSLSSSSEAQCNGNTPVTSSSASGPAATSSANCFQSLPFSNVAATATGSAAYGMLSVSGNDGSKDLPANFQAFTSFADTLHLYGTNPGSGSNQVLVEFFVGIAGQPELLAPIPFSTQGFAASFTGGSSTVSGSETCTFVCQPFSQTYVVSQDITENAVISFSASLSGFGSTFGGGGGVSASIDLNSIEVLDPITGMPLSGLSYSSASGTQYSIDAAPVPEPGSILLLLSGMLAGAIILMFRRVA